MDSDLYRPSEEALERLKHVNFLAVVGPTGAGKSLLISEACKREPSLHQVLNNTSRDPRPNEREGVDFRFETRARMEERIARHEYVQIAPTLFGDLYATAAEDYSTDGTAIMPVLSEALPAFKKMPFKSVRTVFILPPDWATWQSRLSQHGFHADKLARRLAEAKQSLNFALNDKDVLIVINRDLTAAVEDFITIAKREPLSGKLQADQVKAKQIIKGLLSQLEDLLNNPNSL